MTEATFAGDWQGADAVRRFRARYLSITSYKRSGAAVATPVWFVQQDGRLLAETDASSGKVKRIRHNPAIRVAECSASGRIRGEQVPGVAEVLPESEAARVHRLIVQKYRADLVLIGPLRFVQSALHIGPPRTHSVILSITLG